MYRFVAFGDGSFHACQSEQMQDEHGEETARQRKSFDENSDNKIILNHYEILNTHWRVGNESAVGGRPRLNAPNP